MEFVDAGVTGPDECLGKGGSEFWRNLLERPKISPKLFLPVEVDVRVETLGTPGVGKGSLTVLGADSIVDDLSRSPVLLRLVGEEAIETLESFLIKGAPGAAKVMEVLASVFWT